MNITDYRALQEAVRGSLTTDMTIGELGALRAAARRDLDRWQICDCDDGIDYRSDPNASEREHLEGLRIVPIPHEACGGSGLLPNQLTDLPFNWCSEHDGTTEGHEECDAKRAWHYSSECVMIPCRIVAVRAFDKDPTN